MEKFVQGKRNEVNAYLSQVARDIDHLMAHPIPSSESKQIRSKRPHRHFYSRDTTLIITADPVEHAVQISQLERTKLSAAVSDWFVSQGINDVA